MKATEFGARVGRAWNEFLFAPFDLRLAAWLRIGFALLTLINFGVLGLDLEFWFGSTGPMPLDASREVIDSSSHTIFEILPQTATVLWICYSLAVIHTVLLLVGFFPRFQAFWVFFWIWQFQHRNMMIFDGEDQLFRLFAFFMIFLPTHRFDSVHAWWRERQNQPEPTRFGTAWAFRLFQIQTTLVYVGAAWSKLMGSEWRDGIAMWYISRLDDAWGKFPLPDFLFDSLPWIHLLTWATLVVEPLLPLGLWFPRTRWLALGAAVLFHLSLEYTMNLFLFHWLMLVGLIPFVATFGKHRERVLRGENGGGVMRAGDRT